MPKHLVNNFFLKSFFLTLNMDKNETHKFTKFDEIYIKIPDIQDILLSFTSENSQ